TRSDRDWSSDVCSSDLLRRRDDARVRGGGLCRPIHRMETGKGLGERRDRLEPFLLQHAVVLDWADPPLGLRLLDGLVPLAQLQRSEERRVGKEASVGMV